MPAYEPKYFSSKELFPDEYHAAWRRFDERILIMADLLREDFGVMTGNQGSLTECGLRTKEKDRRSQHFYGRAIDLHPKKTTAEIIRKEIIKNPVRYKYIKFLEVDVSWLHIDCRNESELVLWSPTRGFVSKEDYVENGDMK